MKRWFLSSFGAMMIFIAVGLVLPAVLAAREAADRARLRQQGQVAGVPGQNPDAGDAEKELVAQVELIESLGRIAGDRPRRGDRPPGWATVPGDAGSSDPERPEDSGSSTRTPASWSGSRSMPAIRSPSGECGGRGSRANRRGARRHARSGSRSRTVRRRSQSQLPLRSRVPTPHAGSRATPPPPTLPGAVAPGDPSWRNRRRARGPSRRSRPGARPRQPMRPGDDVAAKSLDDLLDDLRSPENQPRKRALALLMRTPVDPDRREEIAKAIAAHPSRSRPLHA